MNESEARELVRSILRLIGFQWEGEYGTGNWWGHDTDLGTDKTITDQGLEILRQAGVKVDG